MDTTTTRTAADLRAKLHLLYAERALAEVQGLTANPGYMADLLDDIHQHRNAFAGAVVTEIASLRGELDGPLRG